MIQETNRQFIEREVSTLPSVGVLISREGKIATFMAVNPNLLQGSAFSSGFRHDRMSWIKTSLAWSMWKADKDKHRSQNPVRESFIEIDIDPEYLQDLFASSVSTSKIDRRKTPKAPDVLRQRDSDREMLFTPNGSFSEFPRRKGEFNGTLHIGVRGDALLTFIEQAAGRIKVLDEVIEEVSKEKYFTSPNASGVIPENGSVILSPRGDGDNFEADIYERLGLSRQSLRAILRQ